MNKDLTPEKLLAMTGMERRALPKVDVRSGRTANIACVRCTNCEGCSMCEGCTGCDNCGGCSQCHDCERCTGCQNCIGIVNGNGLQYVAHGIQFTAAQWDLLMDRKA